ncbi:MAG: hypothetical protein J1F32_00975 [Erysipelotrichales bacterium]|nr:hypothetical protein [Erysipelotrichales bacterium]
MSIKRLLLLIFGAIWYALTIALLVNFIKVIISAFTEIEVEGLSIWAYYFLSWLLCILQVIFVILTCRFYHVDGEIGFGGTLIGMLVRGQWLGAIISLLLSPLFLIKQLIASIKPMWWLIRYKD